MSKRIEHPKSVYLQAQLRSWYLPENSLNGVIKTVPLKTHVCSREELGLNQNKISDAKFFPIQPDSVQDVDRLVGNLHCLDDEQDEEVNLFGHADSGTAQVMRINL